MKQVKLSKRELSEFFSTLAKFSKEIGSGIFEYLAYGGTTQIQKYAVEILKRFVLIKALVGQER